METLTPDEKAMIARGLCAAIIESPPEMVWSMHGMAAEIATKLELRAELRHAAGNNATFAQLAYEQSLTTPSVKIGRTRGGARR